MSLFKRIITLTLVLTMMTGCSFVNNAGAQKVLCIVIVEVMRWL